MSRLTQKGTAEEPVSRDQILRRERGQGNIHFLCSSDHEQDWQPYPVDPYSCYTCDHTYIPGTYIVCERRADMQVRNADGMPGGSNPQGNGNVFFAPS